MAGFVHILFVMHLQVPYSFACIPLDSLLFHFEEPEYLEVVLVGGSAVA